MLGIFSKKKTKELWDSEYQEGRWDYLREQVRFNNSDLISNYLNGVISSKDTILDVGAGNGALFPILNLNSKEQYVPTDLSEVALKLLIEEHGITNGVVNNIEKMDIPCGNYSYIVLNEVIYYLDNPVKTVKRCIAACTKLCIVSMYHSPRTNIIRMFMPKPWFSVKIKGDYIWTVMFYRK